MRGCMSESNRNKTQTLRRDNDPSLEAELQSVFTLQSEVIAVIMVRWQVVEDGGALLLVQAPRQVTLQDI